MYFRQIILAITCLLLYELIKKAAIRIVRSAKKKARAGKIAGLSRDELLVYIDEIVEAERERQHIPGLAIGIVRDGVLILEKGYGFADLTNRVAVSPRTVFELASVSKHMLAVCIMTLAEQGKLSLADSPCKYFEDAPPAWSTIKLRHLLNLSSGLRSESPAFRWTERQPLDVLIRAIYPYPLAFEPGSRWQYSNMNYFLLAAIIEKVTGERFEDYTDRFFQSLGMAQTTTTTESRGPEKACGYRLSKRSNSFTQIDLAAFRPSGAFSSSIADMLRWDSLLLERGILSQPLWTQTYTDTMNIGKFSTRNGSPVGGARISGKRLFQSLLPGPELYYGYGWGVTSYAERTLLTHGGGNMGYTAEYWKFIDDKTSIIVLSNAFAADLCRIVERVYEAVEQINER